MRNKWMILIFLFIFNAGYSLEIQFGFNREWKNVYLKNSQYQLGQDGTFDIILRENEYSFDDKVDLLIHFNGSNNKPWNEYFGNYVLQKRTIQFDYNIKIFGKSSGKLANPKATLLLRPKKTSLFNKTQHIGSFTIEFWLNPATLTDDEIIFKKYGPVVENGKIEKNSGIICKIVNKRLSWQFHHIFHFPSSSVKNEQGFLVKINGYNRLKRNKWAHHALSFDALTGKLTYFVNGREEKSIFVTISTQPEDTILTPKFYPQEKSMLTIGERFYGFIDEFMIYRSSKTSRQKLVRSSYNKAVQKTVEYFSNKTIHPNIIQKLYNERRFDNDEELIAEFLKRKGFFVSKELISKKLQSIVSQGKRHFNIQKYTPLGGIVTSHVYDLKYTGSFLRRLKLNLEQKMGSSIILEYRMSKHFFTPDKGDDFLTWHKLDTIKPSFFSANKKISGRYFQWRAFIKSGDHGQHSPVLKDISFDFEIDDKPSPPKELIVFSSEGKIFLKWTGNVESDVNRYKIYYGIEKGNYLEGKNPIEINVNQLSNRINPTWVISNLSLNKIFYFVVTSLDKNNHESDSSNEVYVRVRKEK